jgi:hypothetical protein
MNQAELNLEIEKAKSWVIETEAELEAVEKLLIRVAEECAMKPYEDDLILNAFHKTGNTLKEAWNLLGEQFKTVVSGTNKIIQEREKMLKEMVENIAEFVKKIRS